MLPNQQSPLYKIMSIIKTPKSLLPSFLEQNLGQILLLSVEYNLVPNVEKDVRTQGVDSYWASIWHLTYWEHTTVKDVYGFFCYFFCTF